MRRADAKTAVVIGTALAVTVTATATGAAAQMFLNVANTATALTTVTGNLGGRLLQLTNNSAHAAATALSALSKSASAATAILQNTGGGPALDLRVNAGKAPFKVNSTGKVASLNVDLLDGLDQSAFARRAQPAWRMVGTAGQPGFAQCHDLIDYGSPGAQYAHWFNYPITGYNQVGFYKDSTGIVHLKGLARCHYIGESPDPTNQGFKLATIFTLPAGYRPASREIRASFIDSAIPNARVDILPSGEVVIASHPADGQHGKDFVGLDGITFRAAR